LIRKKVESPIPKQHPESNFAKAKNIILKEINTVDGNRLAENIIFRINELMTLAHQLTTHFITIN
jgi:hypothetical protein